MRDWDSQFESFFRNKTNFEKWVNKGGHGYNNIMKSMRSIFGAIGPSFKQKTTIPPFQNIELYNLFVGKILYLR